MSDLLIRRTSIGVSWLWLAVFALLPLTLVAVASVLSHDEHHFLLFPITNRNYQQLLDFTYMRVFLRSFEMAAVTTVLCLIIAYPFSYCLASSKHPKKSLLLLLVIIPFWTSSMLRSYAIVIILGAQGLLNDVLLGLHIIQTPLRLLYTNTAVYIGLVYSLLPFMIMPLYANLEKLDHRLIDAARDLGANWLVTFLKVVLPLSLPGILAGSILVLLPAMTVFYIPNLLGGAKALLLGNLIQDQFINSNNWPLGSAISMVLLIFLMGLLAIFVLRSNKNDRQGLL